MQAAQTWREWLGERIEDPQERQRVTNVLGVSPITLVRWVKSEANPYPHNLEKLPSAFPLSYDTMIELIEKEFKGFSKIVQEREMLDQPLMIPPEFYARVLHTCASIHKSLRFSSLCDIILHQMLDILDPHYQGLAVIVARCMPPSQGKKVRSLRESVGRGTSLWSKYLEQRAILLGAESLAGYAVISSHTQINQRLSSPSGLAPGYRNEGEESAVAVPIMSSAKIAGSLLVSSTQPDYFVADRLKLIENSAALVALAFNAEDFYDLRDIKLGTVPPCEVQWSHLNMFRKRVIAVSRQASNAGQPITIIEAEQEVWRQFEAEMLQMSLSPEGR